MLILNTDADKGEHISKFVGKGQEGFFCTAVLHVHKSVLKSSDCTPQPESPNTFCLMNKTEDVAMFFFVVVIISYCIKEACLESGPVIVCDYFFSFPQRLLSSKQAKGISPSLRPSKDIPATPLLHTRISEDCKSVSGRELGISALLKWLSP